MDGYPVLPAMKAMGQQNRSMPRKARVQILRDRLSRFGMSCRSSSEVQLPKDHRYCKASRAEYIESPNHSTTDCELSRKSQRRLTECVYG